MDGSMSRGDRIVGAQEPDMGSVVEPGYKDTRTPADIIPKYQRNSRTLADAGSVPLSFAGFLVYP